MKKLNTILLVFIVLNLFVIFIAAFYHMKVDKLDKIWMFYQLALDALFFLPLTSALSVFWPLIFRTKKDLENPISQTTTSFVTIMFIFIAIGTGFALQELLVPFLYNRADYQVMLKETKTPAPRVKIKDATGDKFKLSEFDSLKFMPVKNHIAFSMGNSFVYFEKMYDGNGAYFVENFRIIAFKVNKQIDYIVSGSRGKLYDGELYAVSPTYFDFVNGSLTSARKMDGTKKIPVIYEASGIYNLSSEATVGIASLVDIFRYNDYIYNSKINFYHLGNIVYNKIAYYILLAFMLVLASSLGIALRNQRPVVKEYLQTAAFFVVSFALTAVLYDTLVSIVNMVYGMII